MANGTAHKVKGYTLNGNIILEGNRILPKDYGHITHGYARTNHALQSLTSDHTIAVQTQEHLAPVNHGNFTVVVTRPQKSLSVYTDSVKELQTAASQVNTTPSALDVVDRGQDPVLENDRKTFERQQAEQYHEWRQQKDKEHERER